MFIPLVPDNSTTIVPKNNTIGNTNYSNADNANFHAIYAQQLLNSSLNPALRQLAGDSTEADGTFSNTIEAMPINSTSFPISNINNFNNQINSATNINNNSDPLSLYVAFIGKKIPYFDPETQEVKEGVVKNIIINEKYLPCLQMDDNSIIRFERLLNK